MIEQLERIWRRVSRMLAAASILAVDDTGPVQALQIRSVVAGLQDDVPRMGEYGLASRPPAGSDAFVVFVAGSATDAAVVATGHQASRPRSLVDGEVMLYDNRGQRVYLSASGIVVEGTTLPITVQTSGSVTINATGGVTINGPLTVNGAVETTGVLKNNTKVVGSGIKVTGVSVGTGVSTGVV